MMPMCWSARVCSWLSLKFACENQNVPEHVTCLPAVKLVTKKCVCGERHRERERLVRVRDRERDRDGVQCAYLRRQRWGVTDRCTQTPPALLLGSSLAQRPLWILRVHSAVPSPWGTSKCSLTQPPTPLSNSLSLSHLWVSQERLMFPWCFRGESQRWKDIWPRGKDIWRSFHSPQESCHILLIGYRKMTHRCHYSPLWRVQPFLSLFNSITFYLYSAKNCLNVLNLPSQHPHYSLRGKFSVRDQNKMRVA